MLLLALAAPDAFDILGITTVAGNVPLHLTQRNARLVCELAGRDDVPVFAGCDRPLVRELVTAEQVHGRSGIDGMDIHTPRIPLQGQYAVDFIIDQLTAAGGEPITLVLTGPLTNLATAIVKQPDILPRIAEIVLMGGASREGGNSTPSAEFNIYVDPQAAQCVFHCGRPITVAGLDVTHQVMVPRRFLDRLRALDTRVAAATVAMLEFFNRYDREKYHSEGAPLHDPCTIAYLLQPSLFEGKYCNLEVETESALTLGHTAVDFWQVTGRPANVTWLHRVDSAGFFELLIDRLSRLAE